jgi:hypothetical protein
MVPLRLKRTTGAVLLGVLASTGLALAQTTEQTSVLGNCLAENTTGRERKELAKWIFFAMAAHPEIKGRISIAGNDAEDSSKSVALIIMRLLTESCLKETRAAVHGNSARSLEVAFEVLGRLAMMELMADEATMKAIGRWAEFMDSKRLAAALGEK